MKVHGLSCFLLKLPWRHPSQKPLIFSHPTCHKDFRVIHGHTDSPTGAAFVGLDNGMFYLSFAPIDRILHTSLPFDSTFSSMSRPSKVESLREALDERVHQAYDGHFTVSFYLTKLFFNSRKTGRCICCYLNGRALTNSGRLFTIDCNTGHEIPARLVIDTPP